MEGDNTIYNESESKTLHIKNSIILTHCKNLIKDINALLLLLPICDEFGVVIMMSIIAPSPASPIMCF